MIAWQIRKSRVIIGQIQNMFCKWKTIHIAWGQLASEMFRQILFLDILYQTGIEQAMKIAILQVQQQQNFHEV